MIMQINDIQHTQQPEFMRSTCTVKEDVSMVFYILDTTFSRILMLVVGFCIWDLF